MATTGRLNTKNLTAIPAAYHTHGTTAYLQADAAGAFLRVATAFQKRFGKRLVAMSFYRPYADQVRIFLKNYYRYNGARRPGTTDRSYNGSTYRLRSGMAPVASPGYSNHGLGITVDFNSGVQNRYSAEHNWMLSEGTKYGWDWTEGRRIGEPWHWSYNSSKDRMKGSSIQPAPSSPSTAIPVADLAETQRQLTALGYSPGPVDGKLGPSTKAAVTAYQKDRGLTADGSPGPTTRKALGADMATMKELDKKIDRVIAFNEQIHWRVDAVIPKLINELVTLVKDIPRLTMQIQVPLEGDQKGQSSNLTGVRKWYAHDIGRIVKLLKEIAAGQKKGLSDEDVKRIAAEVAKLTGE